MVQEKNAAEIENYYRKLTPPQIYTSEGIDRIIISNSVDANTILRKVPRLIKEPVFFLNPNGEKVALKSDDGKIIVNQIGEIQYLVAGYATRQDGWEAKLETCPASEVYSPDMTSTNLNDEQYKVIMDLLWEYNYLQQLQMITNRDFSFELHQLRNDINAIIVPAKSLYAGSVQAVKTFRTVSEGKQETIAPQNKQNALDAFIGKIKGGGQQQQKKPFYM